MRHIVDKTGKYLGIAGSKTELTDEQFETSFGPSADLIKPIWDFENKLYFEGATEEEILLNREVPQEVFLWRIKFITQIMGLKTQIEELLNQLPEPQKTAANYIWEYGNSIDRYSQTVLYLQHNLGLSDIEIDTIFIEANKISL